MKHEYVFGKNTVREVVNSDREVYEIICTDRLVNDEIITKAKKKNIKITVKDKNRIDSMVKGNHQGIVAKIKGYEYADFDSLLHKTKDKTPFFLILDNLEDPHNLGAIIRTADCVGVDGIIIPKNRSVGLSGTVAKASVGAIEYIPVAQVTNLNAAIKKLKDNGVWIVGTDAHESSHYQQVDYKIPIGLVIGSEGKGMRPLIRKACDFLVHIPMIGHVNSLNASVAAAVLMYEVFNQRNGK